MKIHFITQDSLLWPKLIAVGTKNNQPIDPVKEFLKCGILLEDSGAYKARVLCYTNPHHKIEGKKFMAVGYLQLEENFTHFKALMDAVNQIALDNNYHYLLGPMDGNTWNAYRLVSSKQENPFLLEPVTHPYLVNYFKQTGWNPMVNYFSHHTDTMVDNWENLNSRYEGFIDHGITFENFDTSNAKSIFSELGLFCNESFSNNFLFSPIELPKFVELMMPVLPIIDPELTLLARSKQGEIVGFIFAYEDLLNTKKKTLVVKTLARKPEASFKGIGSILSSIVMKRAIRKGFEACIHALMIDTNLSTHISDKFHGKKFREYCLFSKKLS